MYSGGPVNVRDLMLEPSTAAELAGVLRKVFDQQQR